MAAKQNEGKKIQVSIYLTPEQDKELSVQGALKEKESDKSAIARAGIEIVLALSAEDYQRLKTTSDTQNKGIGEVVKEALEKHL